VESAEANSVAKLHATGNSHPGAKKRYQNSAKGAIILCGDASAASSISLDHLFRTLDPEDLLHSALPLR
jgi:hypothetical protein